MGNGKAGDKFGWKKETRRKGEKRLSLGHWEPCTCENQMGQGYRRSKKGFRKGARGRKSSFSERRGLGGG